MVTVNPQASQKFSTKTAKATKKVLPSKKTTPSKPRRTASAYKLIESEFKIVVDNQEQLGWDFGNIPADKSDGAKNGESVVVYLDKSKHLPFGDYTLAGPLETQFRIERKSKEDLYGTISAFVAHRSEQEKIKRKNPAHVIAQHWFDRQLIGLNELEGTGHLIVEATFGSVVSKPPAMSGMYPKTISRTIMKWMNQYPYIHFHFMDNRRLAEVFAYRLMESFNTRNMRKE